MKFLRSQFSDEDRDIFAKTVVGPRHICITKVVDDGRFSDLGGCIFSEENELWLPLVPQWFSRDGDPTPFNCKFLGQSFD